MAVAMWKMPVELLRRVLSIACSLGVLLIAVQWPLGWLAMRVIHPSADVVPLADLYFNICIWGAPAVLGLYGLNGWFIGMQDTRTPLYVAIAQNLLNIVASLSFVYLLHLDIAGVALGTLTAQWFGLVASALFALHRYRRLDSELQGESRKLVTGWGRSATVNRDIFIRTLFLVAVNLFFTSAGARQGDAILSANTVLLTFYTLFSYIMDGFAFAAEAICGRTCKRRRHRLVSSLRAAPVFLGLGDGAAVYLALCRRRHAACPLHDR